MGSALKLHDSKPMFDAMSGKPDLSALMSAIKGLSESHTQENADRVRTLLAEVAAIDHAYKKVLDNPEGDERDVLATISPDDLRQVNISRGYFKSFGGTKKKGAGYGMVKFIWKHGERSLEPPEYQVSLSDIQSFPMVYREYETSSENADGTKREWRVMLPSDHGMRHVVFADSHYINGSELVSVYIQRGDKPGHDAPMSQKKSGSHESRKGWDNTPPADTAHDFLHHESHVEPDKSNLSQGRNTSSRLFDSIDAAAHEAATSPRNYLPEPTDGQKLSGSYKMGRIRISGVDIAIENPQGSVRSGIGFDGQPWANTMQHHYGYLSNTTGADGDHIDVFVQPGLSEDYDGPVYVIDQIDPETGDFDEHKVIIGAYSLQGAKAMYLSNYDKGWQGCGDVTMMTWPEFREWIASGDTTGPVGEAIEMGYDAARFDDIRIGGGLSTLLEAITGFDGDGKKAIQLAGMLGIRPSSLSAGGPLDDDLWNYKSDEYFHSTRMSDYKAKLKDEGRTKSGYLKSNGYIVSPNEDFFELRTAANPYTFRMVDKKTRKPFRFSSEQDASDFAKRLPRGSNVQGPLIDSPDDEVPAQNEQLVADAPGGDVDLFDEPIMPPEDMGGDLFGDEPAPQHMPIEEIPLHEIGLSADVPQFKSGADDETGVVEPLGGKFDRTGVAPIQLWKRRNGRYEVISGRHRLDLARRSGEKTIPSQVHHEDRGFDARRAAMLDAELNIRDGQGKVRDYIDYFTHSGITEADAEAKGLIARSIGQRAFAIATQGSEDLIAAHKAEIISDQAAADIAGLAPGNAAMQAVGIRAIQEGKPIQTAVNTMRAVMALARESGQVADTMDLFGFDDSALREAEAMAKLASRKQRQVGEQLAAIKGAAKRPELARKQGVAVDDPEAVRNRVIELTAMKQRWDNWSSHSDLLAEIRAEISKPGFDSLNADDHEIPDDGYWFWMESLAA